MSGRVEPAEAVERYRRWLASVPLAERSKREYARNVESFCDWLGYGPHKPKRCNSRPATIAANCGPGVIGAVVGRVASAV